MVVNLNTASQDKLLRAGLTAAEVREIEQFRKDNAVFHTKAELKQHCGFSSSRYEEIKDQFTTRRLRRSSYNWKVRPTEYRRQHGDMRDDWDVGHIIARANRGAYHPANYVPMSRAYNQKLKDLHDGVIFAHLSKARVREAVRASRVQTQCLLTFNEALQMKRNAWHNMEELELIREGKGQIAEGRISVAEDSGGVEDRKVPQAAGGVEVCEVSEACLCDAEYCERLIREWIDRYGR